MYKILLVALFSTQVFAANIIENGKMTVTVNNIEQNSTSCKTFQDGNFEGITSFFSNNMVLGSYEFDTTTAEIVSESPRTYSLKVGFMSAENLCATQTFVNNLEIKYSKTQDEVKFEYTYRCNQKDLKRIISCRAI